MLSFPHHYRIDKTALYFKLSILSVLNKNFNLYFNFEFKYLSVYILNTF